MVLPSNQFFADVGDRLIGHTGREKRYPGALVVGAYLRGYSQQVTGFPVEQSMVESVSCGRRGSKGRGRKRSDSVLDCAWRFPRSAPRTTLTVFS
ncbi:MAG: hypothetical protein OER85_18090 [Gammaproteobacteria bacterium]|nr:hypothetical protein [Gammaproteobacteria bacterium]